MAKYEFEQLIQLRETAHVPTSVDFAEFTRAIMEQRDRQSQVEEESGFQTGRRRSSHQGVRPKFKNHRPKRAPAPQPDADGWVTLDKHKKSFGSEEVSEKQKFKESLKDTQVKVRPNNKNISSSKPADARDIAADQPKATFNAFAALDDEDESEEEDEDDEDEE